ncbi:preprotein translocase SecY subunit [Bacteroides sp. CAG:189]|uniref:preprotein translocase subunit SecY n=3 Tax=Bacteroides TaxID=816 RepID=UPI00033576E2|nr:preprotein translocase subunit SecY [Bacteroides sp. CAG:189]CCY47750.1 preprotein translocase SecY subunit [Bacteroides sp. CAG:189]
MRKAIETLKNIWKIEDLRQRILITILFVAIYRFCSYGLLPGINSYVVLPGINPGMLTQLHQQTSEGLLALLNMFSGGAFSNASIFALGIMPYISASIVIQLLGIAVPYFQKLQREGESGRRKMNQYTRYLTIAILLVQAPSYLLNLKMQAGPSLNASLDWTLFMVTSTIILAAGSMFILWLGERITDKGIGNGISFIILIGIIARLPQSLAQEFISRMTDKTGGMIMFLFEMVFLLIVIAGAILLVQGTRKIPVQYAKRIVGNKQYGGARQYIPLKVNAAGVMPIIFAQAIMFIPITLIGFSNVNNVSGFVRAFTDHTSFWYNFVFAVMIILFTYFYTAITINPNQMAEDMKRNNGFIPGIKPGKKTAEYIDDIMSRITLPGSFFLALVAIMPAFAGLIGVKAEFAQFFGGTSLLILVGVVLDTLQQVESHLLMRHYDGLLKSGRIKGRAGVAAY